MSDLYVAASEGNLELVRLMLKQSQKLDPNWQKPLIGQTALHVASFRGKYSVVSTLLEDSRVNPQIQSKGGLTALHMASFGGHANVVRALLQHPRVDPQTLDKKGKTALDIAREENHRDVERIFEELVISEVELLRAENDQFRAEARLYDELREEMRLLREQNKHFATEARRESELLSELARLRDENHDLRGRVERQGQQQEQDLVQKLELDLGLLRAENKRLRAEAHSQDSILAINSELQAENLSLRTENLSLRTEVESSEAVRHELLCEQKDLHEKISTLESQLSTLESQLSRESGLVGQVAGAKKKEAVLRSLIHTLQLENQDLHDQAAKASEKEAGMREELDQMRNEIVSMCINDTVRVQEEEAQRMELEKKKASVEVMSVELPREVPDGLKAVTATLETVESLATSLRNEQRKLVDAENDARDAEKLCPVCMDSKKTTAFTCGHQFCTKCAHRVDLC